MKCRPSWECGKEKAIFEEKKDETEEVRKKVLRTDKSKFGVFRSHGRIFF